MLAIVPAPLEPLLTASTSPQERREREQQDLELVNEMAEEDEEDGFL